MAWLAGYSKRKPITLTGGASGAQTNLQLKLAVSYEAAMDGEFDDIRFTQADGVTLIDAWAEVIVTSTSATVWVEFPTTPANTVEQTYYMYYDHATPVSDWDGAATFLQYHGLATSEFLDSLNLSAALIYESRVKATAATHNLRFGVSNQQAFDADDATYIISYTSGNLRFIRCNNESDANETQKTESPSFTNNTFYKLKIINTGGAVTGFVDDDQIGTGDITTNLPDENLAIGVDIITGTFEQNWAFVRKYAANPPTYEFGSEESAPAVGAIMNQFQKANMGADLYNGAIMA